MYLLLSEPLALQIQCLKSNAMQTSTLHRSWQRSSDKKMGWRRHDMASRLRDASLDFLFLRHLFLSSLNNNSIFSTHPLTNLQFDSLSISCRCHRSSQYGLSSTAYPLISFHIVIEISPCPRSSSNPSQEAPSQVSEGVIFMPATSNHAYLFNVLFSC